MFLTFVDTEKPNFHSCPRVFKTPQGSCTAAVVWGTPQVTDNSAGSITVTCSAESGSSLGIGDLPGGCEARDASKNYVTCTFLVTEKSKKM